MSLVDPVSRLPFAASKLTNLPWLAELFSRLAIRRARRAARRMDWRKASAFYVRAVQLAPAKGSVWVQLGHGLSNLGKADSAQIAYYNATKAEPRLALGHRHLGLVRQGTSLHDSALTSLACALFLNPLDKGLRDALIEDEDEDEAKVEARMAIAALTLADQQPAPNYIGARATLIRTRARRAARRRDWPNAERFYQRLARMRPDDAHAFIQLGHALNEQHKQEEAETAYRRATAAAPLCADAWLHLGYVLTARKRHQLAREAFVIVNRLAPIRHTEHPILESAEVQIGLGQLPNAFSSRKLMCPKDLNPRERFIWLCLATNIESGL